MNIHLLVTDIWFYLTLLLTVGYIILAWLAYKFLKPFMSLLRISKMKGFTGHMTGPVKSVVPSSLRDKLHGAKN